MSTTTSRVIKGAAVSLRLSLSTLSARVTREGEKAVSPFPPPAPSAQCYPVPLCRGRRNGSERAQTLPTVTQQGGKGQMTMSCELRSLRDPDCEGSRSDCRRSCEEGRSQGDTRRQESGRPPVSAAACPGQFLFWKEPPDFSQDRPSPTFRGEATAPVPNRWNVALTGQSELPGGRMIQRAPRTQSWDFS